MKHLSIVGFCLLLAVGSNAQEMLVFHQYNRELNTHSRNGMIALGSWGVGNIIAGTAGALTTEKGSMMFSFHLMNASWNVVNLGIALPAYFSARKRIGKEYDIPGTFKLQRQQETLYAINMAADVLYVGSGVFLQEFGNRYANNQVRDSFKGMGYSLILQGGFLLIFDAVMLGVHKSHWKKNEQKIWEQLEFNGTSIKWNIPSKK
ncbi:MAG: hypothetical protein K9J17_06790 [Flavobacteriales bacterium]|nr:hypothetical protein [Flavobacteriales bacterium]